MTGHFTFLAGTSTTPLHLHVSHAEGVYIYDDQGKRYIDMIAGVSVNNLGHRHPAILRAINEQLKSSLHVMVYGDTTCASQVDLARELASHLPLALQKVYFVNSGSEAVEGALKLARRYTGRFDYVSFNHAYHGSTLGALSMMGGEYYKRAYRPVLPGVRHISFNDMDGLEEISTKTAAVIVEPVQGEAGVILPAPGFLERLRQRCNETGTLLIFDEVQTGFGRTGELFACHKYKVYPDILVLAKALGGGMPLGAFISSEEIMEGLTHDPELGHITTFGGHPVSCAAGLASLQTLAGEWQTLQLEKKEEIIRNTFSSHPLVKEIRGTGLLFAVDTRKKNFGQPFISAALKNGVLTDFFLFNDHSFRISPPLTITPEELQEGCDILLKTLEETTAKR